ncbi:hypothetical protein MTR_7g046430 [Medicago truncatula]|uniref:Uncharacterized protein n=1 Tax=Medicago truncatula TaxID=3880 RepID=G7KUX8_MEDTR|nr:hypothetical protein MTR_7g046430 [Medicago truncatula]
MVEFFVDQSKVLVFENLGIRVKSDYLMIFKNNVLGQVLYGFESLLMYINVETNFKIKFGHREVKIGILGVKNEFFPSCYLTACPVSCSCVFFTRFGFELAFGVNMKVGVRMKILQGGLSEIL